MAENHTARGHMAKDQIAENHVERRYTEMDQTVRRHPYGQVRRINEQAQQGKAHRQIDGHDIHAEALGRAARGLLRQHLRDKKAKRTEK